MNPLVSSTWANLSTAERSACLARPRAGRNLDVSRDVANILRSVRSRGDAAVLEYTRNFDCPDLESLQVSVSEISEGVQLVSPEILIAIDDAIARIQKFHQAQKPQNIRVETAPGVVCEKRFIPIQRVGLYIPGGTAPLPSTLMMLAIPALVAGCPEITLTTPPQRDGRINPVILAAANRLGVRRIFKCGGAQAIAAMAFGTESIAKVDKIFGPGNEWVTEAKMQVAYDPDGAAIDLPAGPSEVLVVADAEASAQFVAADLLSQAEHDRASQVIFVSTSEALVSQVQEQILIQLQTLPRREIAEAALRSSRAILVRDLSEAMELSNRYAPEHLILQVRDARSVAEMVRHAGSVFIGPWSPESVGDYASGTNHVLPTYGFARAFSGLGLDSFYKSISYQELTPQGLNGIAATVECLASAEGLEAHRRAVSLRIAALKKDQAQ